MAMNTTIRVWVRALGNCCRIRVKTVEHAHRVLEHLKAQNVLEGLPQVEIQKTDMDCHFLIPLTTQCTLATLESALGEMPGVECMLSPEATDH